MPNIANISNNILTDSGVSTANLVPTSTTISTTAPLQGGGDLSTNRTFSITQSGAASNGYLSSVDWNTFNDKQPFITAGTTLQYYRGDKTFQTLNTTAVTEGTNLYFTNARAIASTLTGYVSGAGTITSADSLLTAIQKLNGNIGGLTTGVSSVFGRTGAVIAVSGDYTTTLVPEGTNLYYLDSRARAAVSLTTTGSSGASTYNSTTGVFNIPNYGAALSGYVPTSRTLNINGTSYDLSADRSWSVGTVTSVAALTLGTTGTDLSSSVATGTTTPVITLNVPTASAANRGALSAADWSTFNGKVGGVTATSPLASSGGTTPNITIQQSSGSQAGYLSAADWTTFNNKQAAGNYITSLTGEATASGPGAASVTLSNSAVTAKVLTGINITGGTVVDTDSILTAFGKVQNQINGLIGGTIYKGTWNASTNVPALASGVGTKGWYYIVNVAGTTNLDGITDWFVGDWAIFDGTAWQQVDNTDAVVSVNGQTGAVSLTTDNIPEGATNQYFLNSRARAALSFVAGSGAYNSTTGVITIPTNNNQITNGASFITLASLSGTAPIVYSNTTGAISITQAGTSSNGYLSSTDWNTFNNKAPSVSGGYLPLSGGIMTGTITSSNVQPLVFTNNGNSGIFTQSAILVNQNNVSGNTANGIFIERGKITDVVGGETRYFVIGARGGTIQWQLSGTGGSTQYDTAEVKPSADANYFIGRSSSSANMPFRAYQLSGDGYIDLATGAGVIITKLSGYALEPNYTLARFGIGKSSSIDYMLDVDGGSTNSPAASFVKQAYGAGSNGIVARFINNVSTGYSSYIFIGSNPGTDWAIGKNISNPTVASPNFEIVDSSNILTFKIAPGGAITLPTLAGTGTRMVVANASGLLSTQAIPSGTVTGTGTPNYLPIWSTSTGLGDSKISQPDANNVLVNFADTYAMGGKFTYVSTFVSKLLIGRTNLAAGAAGSNVDLIYDIAGAEIFEIRRNYSAATFKLTLNNGTSVVDHLTISSAGLATFTNNLTLSASNGTLDVGGEGIIRGNGSAYRTHEFTTGLANVALYQQRNAAGTVINKINAGGDSYINVGRLGIGTVSPSSKLDVVGNIRSTSTSNSAIYSQLEYDGVYAYSTNLYLYAGSGYSAYLYTGGTPRMLITGDGNFDYGGFNVQSTNNAIYRQAFWGALSIMWRNAEDAYIDSNHTYGSSNTNVATYTSANGIGRLGIAGGDFSWSTYNGSVTAGTAYALTERFNIAPSGAARFSSSVTAQSMNINGASDAVLAIVAPSATAYVSFRNVGAKTWGIGNSFAGTNTNFQIYNLTDNVNALSFAAAGAATFASSVTATSFVKVGGTSSQYLMADGSVTTGTGGAFLPLAGGKVTGNVTFTSTQPLTFTANSNTGTYNQTAIYFNQNNVSGNTGNGIFIERGRLTDSAAAETRYFVIGNRGGAIQWQLSGTGGSTQYDTCEVKPSADADYFVGRFSAGSAKCFVAYQSGSDGYLELRTGANTTVTKLSGYTGAIGYTLAPFAVGQTTAVNSAPFSAYGATLAASFATNQSGAGSGICAYFINNSGGGYSSWIYIGSAPGTDWKIGKNISNPTSAVYHFEIVDSSNNLRMQINNGTGNVTFSSDVIAYSDARLKKNIRNIENPLEKIMKTRGVLYDRIDTAEVNTFGFIAQELEEIFPELVTTNQNGIKGVKYQNAVAVLFEALKQQQKQIDELKKQVA